MVGDKQLEHRLHYMTLSVFNNLICLRSVERFFLYRKDLVEFQISPEMLSHDISVGGKLDLDEALPLLEGIAEALTRLHQHETYHLNIKPSNILFDDGNKVVLADMGFTPEVLEAFGPRGSSFLDQITGSANYM